jgi:hypothetical protein
MASDRVRFRIGPVPAASARSWLGSARQNLLRIIAARDDALPFKLPEEVSDHFVAVLDAWAAVADTSKAFDVDDEVEVDTVSRLFVYWLNLASLSWDQRDRLGLVDPPPEAAPFADALRASMLRSLGGHESLEPLGRFVSNLQGPP